MNKRVLILEPDPDLGLILREVLEETGFEVDVAVDRRALWTALPVSPHQLVIADWPGADPRWSWRELEELIAAARPAPVGVMSVLPPIVEGAAARGAAFALAKPFTLAELLVGLSVGLRGALSAEDVARVRAYFDALTARDWDGLVALCSEDVEYRLPGDSEQFSRTVRGREAFRTFSIDTFAAFPECRFTVDEVVPLPGGAIGRYHAVWRGRSEPVTGAVLFKLDQGRIAQIGVRADVTRLLG